ncbi:MAG: apolipoprotein N-acyltransferase [Proteobacteria bacterium]|jgi:apolipoprotein N-acyltransferase|nr:apolipoprotein N-acyltransferase [Pseudomonadota bacterium]
MENHPERSNERPKERLNKWRNRVLLILSGALSTLAFAPVGWWWILPFTLAFLFHGWLMQTPRQAAQSGFLFGFGLFVTGVSWIYVSLKIYGNMPAVMAMVGVFLFVSVLSLFPMLAGYLQAHANKLGRSCRLLLLIPAVWTVAEVLRGFVLTGFPWLNIGYSQTDGPLAGFAPLGGVVLTSFTTALIAGGLTLAYARRNLWPPLLIGLAVLLAVSFTAKHTPWTEPAGQEFTAAAVQGNVSLERKWQASYRQETLENYLELSSTTNASLVVWPETAVAFYVHEFSEPMWEALSQPNQTLVFGALEARYNPAQESETELYNAAIATCNGSRQIYRKQHLVPFGEFLPFSDWLGWLLDYLQIPMSDFSSWDGQQTIDCGDDLKLSISICFEDAFEEEFRQASRQNTVLVNLSEDAWFGDSLAPHQRLQMARMRVLENAKPMVRAGNTGPSAIIDYDGEILAISAQFETALLEADIQPRRGLTLYARLGNTTIIAFLLFIAGLGIWFGRK